MPTERIRQTVSGPIRTEEIEQRQREGWHAVAIEWERTMPERAQTIPAVEEPPFGLRVAEDCQRLEENPGETEVLLTMMELILDEGPYSSIADELNRKGYVTRQGSRWNPVRVFEMLPRLIEAGPKIFSTDEWRRRRQKARQGTPA